MFARPPRDQDRAIRETDSDAAQARLSAVRKSYLQDPFIDLFIPFFIVQSDYIQARPPLINIGTYIRSKIIDDLIIDWARVMNAANTPFQIVSVGAGSDTRFWRLANGLLSRDTINCSRYLEIDFPETVLKKIEAIKRQPKLQPTLGEFTVSDKTLLTSSKYILRGIDLRNTADFAETISLLDSSLPTLVLAECVLVYMSKERSDALLKHLTDTFSCVGAIVYEMYGLNDDFGRVMKANLRTRHLTLPGIDAYATLDDQTSRFLQTGFTRGQALSLKALRYDYVGSEEHQRVAKLEFLDEIEELDLVLNHYAISWGLKPSESLEEIIQRGTADWGLTRKTSVIE